MSPRVARIAVSLVVSIACWALPAHAFFSPPPVTTVVEYKNVNLNHYFLTADADEIAIVDSGGAGPGWVRTGYGFEAHAFSNPFCGGCRDVSRFYAPGPNSHFFTADTPEAEGLKRPGSGWIYEKVAFAVRVPDAAGQCGAGGAPVYRVYNGRFPFNDSNHRYMTSPQERAAMIAAGWIDEGARFCAISAKEIPFSTFAIDIDPQGNILPSADCENDAVRLGGCIAVNNLTIPRTRIGPYDGAMATRFSFLTGIMSPYVFAPGLAAPDVIIANTFVQASGSAYGLHIDSRRPPDNLSSVNPLYQFSNAPDARFYPWRASVPFETQLSMRAAAMINKVNPRNSQSYAYGHPTLEFIDALSGHHLYFTVLAYGNQVGNDFVAIDSGTGKVIVSTTFREGSSFARSMGTGTMHFPSGYDAGLGSGRTGIFEFRMDVAEFQRVLDAGRTADPALSSNPADYFLDNYHFTNEASGDSEIAVRLGGISLRVIRR